MRHWHRVLIIGTCGGRRHGSGSGEGAVVACVEAYKKLAGSEVPSTLRADFVSAQSLYRRFALRYHPDHSREVADGSVMSQGNLAYETLRAADAETREQALKVLRSPTVEVLTTPLKKLDDTPSITRRATAVPFWDTHRPLYESEEEYRAFLKTLPGDDTIRFYKCPRRHEMFSTRCCEVAGAMNTGSPAVLFACLLQFCGTALLVVVCLSLAHSH